LTTILPSCLTGILVWKGNKINMNSNEEEMTIAISKLIKIIENSENIEEARLSLKRLIDSQYEEVIQSVENIDINGKIS